MTRTLGASDLAATAGPEQDTMSLVSSLRDSSGPAHSEDFAKLESQVDSLLRYKAQAIMDKNLIRAELSDMLENYRHSQKALSRIAEALRRREMLD